MHRLLTVEASLALLFQSWALDTGLIAVVRRLSGPTAR